MATGETAETFCLAAGQGLASKGIAAEVVKSTAQVGGGSLPELELESFAVELSAPDGSAKEKEKYAERTFRRLLDAEPPVLAVLREGRLILDVFTVSDDGTDNIVKMASRLAPAD